MAELPENGRARVPRRSRIESVFLNIPYDDAFENLYLAYIVGLTHWAFASTLLSRFQTKGVSKRSWI